MTTNTNNNTINSAKSKAAEALSATTASANEAIRGAIKTGSEFAQTSADQASKAVSKIVSFTAQNANKTNSTLVESFDGFSGYVRENLNAITKSNADLLAGFEAITKQIFSFAQSQLESSLSLQKSLVGSKNLRDAFETQLEYAKSSYEQGINELTKISENVLKVANQSAEPIQSRINNTIEKAFKSSI